MKRLDLSEVIGWVESQMTSEQRRAFLKRAAMIAADALGARIREGDIEGAEDLARSWLAILDEIREGRPSRPPLSVVSSSD